MCLMTYSIGPTPHMRPMVKIGQPLVGQDDAQKTGEQTHVHTWCFIAQPFISINNHNDIYHI